MAPPAMEAAGRDEVKESQYGYVFGVSGPGIIAFPIGVQGQTFRGGINPENCLPVPKIRKF